jgi:hypothetical protein
MLLEQAIASVAVALLSAIVGGFIGFHGASRLREHEQRDRQRAAGRALLVELMANYKGPESLEKDLYDEVPGRWPDFMTSYYYAKNVWQETLPLVSPMLRWSELEKLATAYQSFEKALDKIKSAGRGVARNSPNDLWADFRKTLQKIGGHEVRTALIEFFDAIKLVAPKVLDKDEREKIPLFQQRETNSRERP